MARLAESPTPFWRGSLPGSGTSPPQITFRPGEAFVLMEITSQESGAVYDAIRKGCRPVGLTACRVDEKSDAALIMRDVVRLD